MAIHYYYISCRVFGIGLHVYWITIRSSSTWLLKASIHVRYNIIIKYSTIAHADTVSIWAHEHWTHSTQNAPQLYQLYYVWSAKLLQTAKCGMMLLFTSCVCLCLLRLLLLLAAPRQAALPFCEQHNQALHNLLYHLVEWCWMGYTLPRYTQCHTRYADPNMQ